MPTGNDVSAPKVLLPLPARMFTLDGKAATAMSRPLAFPHTIFPSMCREDRPSSSSFVIALAKVLSFFTRLLQDEKKGPGLCPIADGV